MQGLDSEGILHQPRREGGMAQSPQSDSLIVLTAILNLKKKKNVNAKNIITAPGHECLLGVSIHLLFQPWNEVGQDRVR